MATTEHQNNKIEQFHTPGTKTNYSFNVEKKKESPFGIIQVSIVSSIEHYRNIYASPENFIKRKVDYSRMKVYDEKYRKESERFKSLVNFPEKFNHLKMKIAKAGFYYFGDEKKPDKVKCIFCQGILSDWNKNDDPVKEHKKSFPTCPFLLNLNVGNEKCSEEVKDKNVDFDFEDITENNKNIIGGNVNIQLSDNIEDDIESREITFSNHNNLIFLCLDGLFVSNKDCLTCCKCKKSVLILKNIEEIPRKNFHYSNCDYLKLINDERSRTNIDSNNNAKKDYCWIDYSITPNEIEARLDSRLVDKIEVLKYNRYKIKAVFERKLKSTGTDYHSTYEFLRDLKYFIEEDKQIRASDNISEFLFEQFCVVCLDKAVAVVFLPCGHLKTCFGCSSLLSTCPICRQLIERRVYGIKFRNI